MLSLTHTEPTAQWGAVPMAAAGDALQQPVLNGSSTESASLQSGADSTTVLAENICTSVVNGGSAGSIVIREVEYIQALSERINALIASNERVMKTYRKYFWHLGMFASFLRGVIMGFGWVIGTTIVVGGFILLLHSFDSVPIVGEFVGRIMEYLEKRP
jgi:hypothetical protein